MYKMIVVLFVMISNIAIASEPETLLVLGDITAREAYETTVMHTAPTDGTMLFYHEFQGLSGERFDAMTNQLASLSAIRPIVIIATGKKSMAEFNNVETYSTEWRDRYTARLSKIIESLGCSQIVIVAPRNFKDRPPGIYELIRQLQKQVAMKYLNVGWMPYSNYRKHRPDDVGLVKYIKDTLIRGNTCIEP